MTDSTTTSAEISPSPAQSPQVPTKTSEMVVLLVDDQLLIGESVRRMLVELPEIRYHYCQDPTLAIAKAIEVQPTVILQDLVMPQVDGLELVRQFRQDERTRQIPLVVLSTREEPKTKAEAFAIGANDYLVKLPDRLELIARIRYHSQAYLRLLQRDAAYRQLERDLQQAAKYVQSLLPKRWTEPVAIDWRFIPSAALGGDTFGYHWLDREQRYLAVYLIDVVGHGVGPALLSVSVLNALRSQSLPSTDFLDPGQVMTGLNRSFQMESQGDQYFTAWYGVLDCYEGRLSYSGGGHPPGLFVADPNDLHGTQGSEPVLLESDGPMVGAIEGLDYESSVATLSGPGWFYLYSDGVYEIERTNGTMWPFEQFVALMAKPLTDQPSALDRLITEVRSLTGQHAFQDDFSILTIRISGRLGSS